MIRLIFAFFLLATSCTSEKTTVSLKEGETPLTAKQTCQNNPSVLSESDIDMDALETQLQGDGLGGWVHAAVQDQMMFVFTWRQPGSFFVNVQLPMTSRDPQVLEQLKNLKRHDQVSLKGAFIDHGAPIKHINVTEVTIVNAYDGPSEPFQYNPNLPDEILTNTSLVSKVHIVANAGAVLVVELGDRVYPVFNSQPALAQCLYRNDKIKLNYKVRQSPGRPPHLEVDTTIDEPLEILEKIVDGHDQETTLSGALVMFPKSPQIRFNVFALRQEDSEGISRNFTIINFDNFDVFREKLQEAWTQHEEFAEYDRNKYINRKIQVTVKGIKNVISPTQANPQIMPELIDDVEIEFL